MSDLIMQIWCSWEKKNKTARAGQDIRILGLRCCAEALCGAAWHKTKAASECHQCNSMFCTTKPPSILTNQGVQYE